MPFAGSGAISPINQMHPGLYGPVGIPQPIEYPNIWDQSLAPYTDYSDILKPMAEEDYKVWIAENPEFYGQITDQVKFDNNYGLGDSTDYLQPNFDYKNDESKESESTENQYPGNDDIFKFNAQDWISGGAEANMLTMAKSILDLINSGDVSGLYKVGGCMLTIVQYYFKSRNHKIRMNEIIESEAGKALKKGIQSRFVTTNSAQLTQFEKDLQEKTPENFETVKTKFYEDLTEQNMNVLEEVLNKYLTQIFSIQKKHETMDSQKQ